MEIIRPFQIAKREWGNIRSSLEVCGDIGEFDSENPINNRLTEIKGSPLVENLIRMENKFQTYGYFTPEAGYVFSALVSAAAERLGLVGGLAEAFGNGYSWVRTGWFDLDHVGKQHVIKQLFFMKIFFPLGGYFNWDFNSRESKIKLKAVFSRFFAWQNSPRSYIQDIIDFRDQIEPLLLGLFLALGHYVPDGNKKYQMGLY
ncbi:MAG: hypothetical protein C4291_03905 [Candidatus Dadabacteria bacterium]